MIKNSTSLMIKIIKMDIINDIINDKNDKNDIINDIINDKMI